MYLNRDKIKEIRATDKITPLGSPISEVEFFSELELIHEAIDEVRDRMNKATEELKGEELDTKLEELNKEELDITSRQTGASDENRVILVSQATLDHCQTEAVDPEYYDKRKNLITRQILEIMTEWGIEDVEFGSIMQGVGESANHNKQVAIGKKFDRDYYKINFLDYHYAIIGENRTAASPVGGQEPDEVGEPDAKS